MPGGGTEQVPAMHINGALHVLPQDPQLLCSVTHVRDKYVHDTRDQHTP